MSDSEDIVCREPPPQAVGSGDSANSDDDVVRGRRRRPYKRRTVATEGDQVAFILCSGGEAAPQFAEYCFKYREDNGFEDAVELPICRIFGIESAKMRHPYRPTYLVAKASQGPLFKKVRSRTMSCSHKNQI